MQSLHKMLHDFLKKNHFFFKKNISPCFFGVQNTARTLQKRDYYDK